MNPVISYTQYPIILAPMLGVVTPEMVAAVAEAGGLGSLPLGGLSVEASRKLIRKTRQLTSKTFAVNFFANTAPDVEKNKEATGQMLLFIQNILKKKNWAENTGFCYQFYPYQDLIDLIIEEDIRFVSFTFGVPDDECIQKLKSNGIILTGTATSVSEAVMLEKSGVDTVVAQGIEAGGHRGTFLPGALPQTGLFALVPQIADAVKIPVIASGGICDQRTMQAAFNLGAGAVQIGSYFINAEESLATDVYRNLLKRATDTATQLTRSYTGRWARGIRNNFMELIENSQLPIPDYPIQNLLTTKMRELAKQHGDAGFMNFWAGQNARYAPAKPTEAIINELIVIYKTIHAAE
ncbi:2-nitropropane dioxygenase [Niabella ginsenosidivorans]|uniref:Nitronate monooxygenase n=2 Tax=Niabella ginsenosidivorans TaxID=1176587 RepID=A0A1A9I7M3_9BACT|nr:2-nitropropane dioxygenase [Niabella ginsenosidivorans]